MVRVGAVLVIAAVAGCGSRAVVVGPAGPPARTCPLEGCDAARVAALASSSAAPSACPGTDEMPCAGAAAAGCTDRALAAWSDAQDDHAMACIARTLVDACGQGEARACGFAGRLLLDGRGVARDVQRGLGMLVSACDAGIALPCRVAVRWLADPEHERVAGDGGDLRTRLDEQHECLAGSADACFDVAIADYTGREGFPLDRARSAAFYDRGCSLGQRIACNNLGDAFEYGSGVKRDLARAASLYKRACDLGEALGCSNLGHLVETGDGAARDPGRSRRLYRHACAGGDVYGCLHLELLAARHGGSAGGAQELSRWERACSAHDARACAFVGLIYEDGPDGYARDERKSQAAMRRGCDLGERRACDWIRVHPGS